MAETLTSQTPESTELNAEEQESLKVGEQMEQEQSQMLAGKYKSPQELEKAYLELQSKLGQSNSDEQESEEEDEPSNETEPPEQDESENESEDTRQELTQEDVDFLHNLAGGKEGYNSMVQWASDNFEDQEVQMFDSIMEDGNPAAVYFAVQSLVSRFNDANGKDGNMLVGTSAKTTVDSFKSQQELVAAMSDPRYDNDPAYREAVISKLDKSDLQF